MQHKTTLTQPIDFVITWVDGNDPAWQGEFAKYHHRETGIDVSPNRFRDWGNLHYWFRSVEQFAPWINKIHFVTWGHIPSWLDTTHPKLNIVKHEDFIDAKYLPLFSSLPIELMLHKIKELSEQFVYFNDDMFILKPTKPSHFFKRGLPRDIAALNTLNYAYRGISQTVLNDMIVINSHFNARKVLLDHPLKWFNFRYSMTDLYRNFSLAPWKLFSSFLIPHQPISFLKSTYDTVWKHEKELLNQTMQSRFRNNPVNNSLWLMRFWQLVTGEFLPIGKKDSKYLGLNEGNYKHGVRMIEQQKYRYLCLNDDIEAADIELYRKEIQSALESILPKKCAFER